MKVSAKHLDDNYVQIIIDDGENEQEITAKVSASGVFRFTYKHPELDEPDQYQGVFHTKYKMIIYPIYGKGVISNDFIYVE